MRSGGDAGRAGGRTARPASSRRAAGCGPMSVRVYIPRDSGARAVGADSVAAALAEAAQRRNIALEIIRTGSRGLYWLEPMIEVATPDGRIAYGPVTAGDVAGLLDAGFVVGGPHALRLG